MDTSISIEEAVARRFAGVRPAVPDVAIVLGSGLGDFANRLGDAVSIPYGELPHWPVSTVIGHEGRLVLGTLAGKRVAALSGRVHFYEGHDLGTVTFATRVLGTVGRQDADPDQRRRRHQRAPHARHADGHRRPHQPDGHQPARRLERRSVRAALSRHDRGLFEAAARRLPTKSAARQALTVGHGVYVALHGPSYETPAEIRFLRKIGADAVGMSTVPEAIVARHMGVDVLGISCITNAAAGVLPQAAESRRGDGGGAPRAGAVRALLEGIIARI